MKLSKSMQARSQYMEDAKLRLEWIQIENREYYWLKIWRGKFVVAITNGSPDACVESMYYECRRKGYLK